MLAAQAIAQSFAAEATAFVGGVVDLLGHIVNVLLSADVVATASLCAFVVMVDFLRRGFRVVWPRRIVEGTLATIAIVAANVALGPLVVMLAKGFEAVYAALHVPRIDPAVWADVPAWLLVPLAMFVYDVANYLNHRAMHTRWLWPVHAVHHSDPDVTGLSTLRVHGLEALVMAVSYTFLLSWLGFPPNVMGGAAILLTLLNSYQHVNVDWGHGPLRHVIASPRFHRWHHADVSEAHGKNLANVFPFIDVAFGTYYVPGRCDAKLGAEGVPENDVVRLLLFPFVAWGQMAGATFRPLRRKALAGE